jgi:hypothetical protein
VGWVEGFEPSISRATTWRVKPLHYTHHGGCFGEVTEPIISKIADRFNFLNSVFCTMPNSSDII